VTVWLLPQAKRDLDAIHDPLYTRVVRRLRLLETTPSMGAPMLGPFAGYRSTVVGLCRIVYRLIPKDGVEVAYIRHCRRAPPG
jgi:hypothetical protein